MLDHHAVLYTAPNAEAVPALAALDRSSPDVRVTKLETLDIGSVRGIIEDSSRRPVRDAHLTMLIETKVIAHEAQHALLKILEEPPATTRFVIVMPGAHGLLPTVRSRLAIVANDGALALSEGFTTFLALPVGARMELIAEKTKAKDAEWIGCVLRDGISFASEHPEPSLKQTALTIASYHERRGASRKMLLEELALSLPVMNEKR